MCEALLTDGAHCDWCHEETDHTGSSVKRQVESTHTSLSKHASWGIARIVRIYVAAEKHVLVLVGFFS